MNKRKIIEMEMFKSIECIFLDEEWLFNPNSNYFTNASRGESSKSYWILRDLKESMDSNWKVKVEKETLEKIGCRGHAHGLYYFRISNIDDIIEHLTSIYRIENQSSNEFKDRLTKFKNKFRIELIKEEYMEKTKVTEKITYANGVHLEQDVYESVIKSYKIGDLSFTKKVNQPICLITRERRINDKYYYPSKEVPCEELTIEFCKEFIKNNIEAELILKAKC